jgi:hypothetical protein
LKKIKRRIIGLPMSAFAQRRHRRLAIIYQQPSCQEKFVAISMTSISSYDPLAYVKVIGCLEIRQCEKAASAKGKEHSAGNRADLLSLYAMRHALCRF